MAVRTYTESVPYQVAEPLSPARLVPLGNKVARRSLSLMLRAMVVGSFMSGLALAAPYSTGRGMMHESAVEPVAHRPEDHAPVLAAGFGFQAAGSSLITVRTYDVPSGVILSEDSFDVSVKEEGAAEYDGNRGRVFAGGIGIDTQGKSKFMLRVYDAETGRFLWEGQLNLLKVGEGGGGPSEGDDNSAAFFRSARRRSRYPVVPILLFCASGQSYYRKACMAGSVYTGDSKATRQCRGVM